jgi:hypothetical protein
VTWRFKDAGYAYLPGSNGEKTSQRLNVIGRERQSLLRRLEERPGFSDENPMTNWGRLYAKNLIECLWTLSASPPTAGLATRSGRRAGASQR